MNLNLVDKYTSWGFFYSKFLRQNTENFFRSWMVTLLMVTLPEFCLKHEINKGPAIVSWLGTILFFKLYCRDVYEFPKRLFIFGMPALRSGIAKIMLIFFYSSQKLFILLARQFDDTWYILDSTWHCNSLWKWPVSRGLKVTFAILILVSSSLLFLKPVVILLYTI